MLRGWTVAVLTISAALLTLGWVTGGLQYRLQGVMSDPPALTRTSLGVVIAGMLAFALILNRRIRKD